MRFPNVTVIRLTLKQLCPCNLSRGNASVYSAMQYISAPDINHTSCACHAHQQLQEINTYTLAHAPLSLTRGTLVAYPRSILKLQEVGHWWRQWHGQRKHLEMMFLLVLKVCTHVIIMYMHMLCTFIYTIYYCTYIALYLYNYTHTAIFHFTCTYALIVRIVLYIIMVAVATSLFIFVHYMLYVFVTRRGHLMCLRTLRFCHLHCIN